ncbi:DUF1134 domain-containing protein [Erythrobacter sp. W53]|uniref:DUF1134 domain-containing protein n=1 Tax=Erythrobacteraceae TaxID=335929 RepID=UPI0036D339FF
MSTARNFPGLKTLRMFGLALGLIGLGASPLAAQMETMDPDTAIDGDLMPLPDDTRAADAQAASGELPSVQDDAVIYSPTPPEGMPADQAAPSWDEQGQGAAPQANAAEVDNSTTYREDDLIGAAEGVFGKGAKGVATLIQDLLAKQGEPNAYIVGREAGGAFVVGARYGSGTMFHKVEGEMPVYWTGPSIGFDAGANAGSTFVLVYNLYDSEELYERYPSGEGQAYVVGGMTASYLRKGDVVLIPIRVGAGLRLGVNAGYMKFSKKQRWLPF